MAIRNLAYDWGLLRSYRSPLPVISVGNLSVGGTGKSPCVAWIARWLRAHDIRVAILSRGYGQLDSGQNDEALELELQLPDVPHLQHWDRSASAVLAHEELEMQALLLDDGFQHRRMARDLDIVMIDATDPPSALHVLPGGLLREPLSALRRADVVLLSRAIKFQQRTCRNGCSGSVDSIRSQRSCTSNISPPIYCSFQMFVCQLRNCVTSGSWPFAESEIPIHSFEACRTWAPRSSPSASGQITTPMTPPTWPKWRHGPRRTRMRIALFAPQRTGSRSNRPRWDHCPCWR